MKSQFLVAIIYQAICIHRFVSPVTLLNVLEMQDFRFTVILALLHVSCW